MSNTSRYERKLSAIERYNLVINTVCRYNVDGVVIGRGEFDPEQWQRAVDIAAEANPGSRVRLRSWLGFCKWVDSGISPRVEIVEAPDWDGNSERGADFLRQKFDASGPVCDIKLIPGDPAKIVFRGLHAAMDARGIEHFGLDVFRVLRGEQPIGSHDTITDLDVRLSHQDKIKAEESPKISCIPTMEPPPESAFTLEYTWRRIRIPRKISSVLPKMAIFLAEQARQHSSGNVLFTIPVDFRGLRCDARTTGNLTGYLKIPVEPDDRPKEVMRRINQQIRDYADCINPGYMKILPWVPIRFLSKMLAKNACQMLYTTNEDLPTGGIVSLGHFDKQAYCYPGFEAEAGFGIPGSVGKLNVLLHNYSEETEVVFSTPKGYNEHGQLDSLIEAFQASFANQ